MKIIDYKQRNIKSAIDEHGGIYHPRVHFGLKCEDPNHHDNEPDRN